MSEKRPSSEDGSDAKRVGAHGTAAHTEQSGNVGEQRPELLDFGGIHLEQFGQQDEPQHMDFDDIGFGPKEPPQPIDFDEVDFGPQSENAGHQQFIDNINEQMNTNDDILFAPEQQPQLPPQQPQQPLDPQTVLTNLLFNETVQEVLAFRDTMPATNNAPQQQHYIGMNAHDIQYLAQRQPIAYRIVDNLGSGSYGSVVKAELHVHTGFVAIKVYKIGGPAVCIQDLIDEVTLIRRFREIPHRNILKSFAFFKHPQYETYYLVTEYSTLTDLYTALQIRNTAGNSVWLTLDEAPIRHLSRGIAEGLCHLHVNGIAHGDLKLENVLIFWKKNTTQQQRLTPVRNVVRHYQRLVYQWIPKLADFSNSLTHKPTDPPGEIWHNYPKCSITYAAPESWSTCPPILAGFTNNVIIQEYYEAIKADAFSLGCCILAFAICAHPYDPLRSIGHGWPSPNDPLVNAKQWKYINVSNSMKRDSNYLRHVCRHLSAQMKRVVMTLLDPNPNTRLTANQFLTDEWITKPHAIEESYAWKPARRRHSYTNEY